MPGINSISAYARTEVKCKEKERTKLLQDVTLLMTVSLFLECYNGLSRLGGGYQVGLTPLQRNRNCEGSGIV